MNKPGTRHEKERAAAIVPKYQSSSTLQNMKQEEAARRSRNNCKTLEVSSPLQKLKPE